MTKEPHDIQKSILKVLLLKETARFSELNIDKLSTDQLTFHIKKLLEAGIVGKTDSGRYHLTLQGKEYANQFDIDSGPMKLERQAKLGVLVIATREVAKEKEYLMQTRLKQPFFGFRGFVTGKIKWGESVAETAQRELSEETGLSSTLELKAICHERIFSKDKELLEDKYFYIFLARDVQGELITEFGGGKNAWLRKEEVLSGSIFYDIEDLLNLVASKDFVFSEKSYTVEKF